MKAFRLEPKVLTFPNALLVARNAPADVSSEETLARIREMFRILYQHEGIGLAAPQIGWNVRLFILNLTGREHPVHEQVFMNPEVYSWGSMESEREGCLSFPGMSALIERPRCCRISFRDQIGRYRSKDCTDLEARAVQHEMDHLEGVLFYERMNKLDRERNDPILRSMIERSLKKG
jgi:peptide deformylase